MRPVIFLLVLAVGCAPPPEDQVDVCEQAARHREACLGDYVTPPPCDETADRAARSMLARSCDEMAGLQDPGKADGAFCDWFGAGCTPDEALFEGPACSSDAGCGSGFCLEGHCFEGVVSEEFAGILDTWTQTPEDQGSYTQLLVDNSETRALRRALVESAEHSVHFTAFMIADDETGHEMVELFGAAARRGLEVRVAVDATTQYSFSKYAILEQMRDAGVQIIPFNAATEWAGLRLSIPLTVNDRFHEKMLIVDGAEAIMGGRNVGDEYLLPDRWRDTDVYVVGPGVAGIQRMFLTVWDKISAWELAAGCPNQADYGFTCPDGLPLLDDPAYYATWDAMGTARTRPVYSDPYHQETPLGYLTTLALVRSARESITIANSYFVPPRRLRKHLKAAAARGVKVTVLTNSKESTDAWWMYYASLNYYEELIRGGIEIHQYRGTETMHAKTMLIDDALAVVGSYNLDPRSAVDNTESMLLIRGGGTVDELRAAMDEDLSYADPAGYDIPLAEMIKAKSFRLFEPLL